MRWRVAFDLATDPTLAYMSEATRTGEGLAPEPAIIGTAEWWGLVGSDGLPLHTAEGVIEDIVWTGHGDYPEFTMRTADGALRRWERYGDHTVYVGGLAVRLSWIRQRWVQPTSILGDATDVVIRVEVEDSERRSPQEGRPRPTVG